MAFWELSSDRGIGMGLGPIPGAAALKRAELFGLDFDETAHFLSAIRAMDAVWLKFQSDKDSEAQEPEKPRVAKRELTMDLFDALWS